MFKVKLKDNKNVVYTVYSTKQGEHGVTSFLIFTMDKWIWRPADEFIPFVED